MLTSHHFQKPAAALPRMLFVRFKFARTHAHTRAHAHTQVPVITCKHSIQVDSSPSLGSCFHFFPHNSCQTLPLEMREGGVCAGVGGWLGGDKGVERAHT